MGPGGVRTGANGAGPRWPGARSPGPYSPGGTAARSPSVDDGFQDWFADVDNYSGFVDRTDRGEVEVLVGAPGNGGAFAYEPPAIRVATGTTVVWRWTGDGGQHDVVAVDESFRSPLTGEADATFRHTFATPGRYPYYCTPHWGVGMKGGVVVD